MRAWIITRDYIADKGEPTDVGTIGPRDASDEMVAQLRAGKGYAFILKDDDGITYYRGRAIWADDDVEMGAYGPLADFGAPNAGCTSVSYPKHPEFDCA